MSEYGVELWTSDDNREIHCFKLDGSAAGYSYLCGFDPDMIDPLYFIDILRRTGHHGAADAITARLERAAK